MTLFFLAHDLELDMGRHMMMNAQKCCPDIEESIKIYETPKLLVRQQVKRKIIRGQVIDVAW